MGRAQGFGMTEMTGVGAGVAGDDYAYRPGSTGLPPPVVDLRIVNGKDGKEVGVGEVGEVWL